MRLLALLVAAALVGRAHSHGFLADPPARNVLANSDYCPQCLSAGGPAVVSGGAAWPGGKWGHCGDPAAGPLRHEAGGAMWTAGGSGKPVAVWRAGDIVTLTSRLTAFHKGRLGFRICRIQGTDVASEKAQLTEACLEANVLRQAAVPGAQAPGDRWYHLGQTNSGGGIYNNTVQLPAGLTCDGVTASCVLQWYYMTGNSCDPPNEPAPYSSPSLATCGPGAPYPEEFWNCADVRILPAGPPLPPSPPMLPSPPPAPVVVLPPIPEPNPNPDAPPDSSGNQTTTDPCRSGDAACYCKWQAKDGMFADSAVGCAAYYQCTGAASYYLQCPKSATGAQLRFNDKFMYCDWPENVACTVTQPIASPPPSPAAIVSSPPPPTASPPPSPAVVVRSPPPPSPRPPAPRPPSPRPPPPKPVTRPPPPRPVTRPPPPKPITARPPPPKPVAASPPPPTGAAPAPVPAATFCATKAPATGFFSDPLSCLRYYRCEVSGSWLFQCQVGLAFNQAISACDWPANVPGCAVAAGRRLARRMA